MRTVLAHNPYCVAGPYQDIYSHAVETDARRTLYVSGQVGVANDGSVVDSFAGQTRQAIANLIAVIEGAGMSPQNIVRLGFFLVRRADFAELADLRRELLPGIRPAITNVLVAGLVSAAWLIEVEATVVADS